MFKKILVPIDGSATSKLGLKQAARLARSQNATLTLLHVVDENVVTQTAATGGVYVEGLIESLVAAGKRILAAAEAEAKKEKVRVRGVLVEDIGLPVADVIVAQAKKLKADLIVLGTHGRRGLSRLVMGSDAENVVRQTSIPVLLVRGGARAPARRKPRRR